MATNKRKDAAALFELIDKSTLKVPKNAGALKIPRWWSSQSADSPPADKPPRPAAHAPARPPAAPRPLAKVPPPIPADTPPASVDTPAPSLETAPPDTPEIPIQHRLFDPPPANVAPVTTPSIRPPAAGVTAVSPSIKAPPPDSPPAEPAPATPLPTPPAADLAPAPAPPPASPAAAAAPPTPTPKPAIPPAARVFAPQTHAQDRSAWSPRPGAFARLPVWVMVSAAAVVLLIGIGILTLARNLASNPPTATAPAVPGGSAATGVTMQRGSTPPPAPQKMLFMPGEFPHSPEKYYIVIYTTPTQVVSGEVRVSQVALDYAKWLAGHGIAVSIENMQPQPNGPYFNWIVSAFGLSTATSANQYRDHIAKTGDALKKGVFRSAIVRNGLASPGTVAEPPDAPRLPQP
jgi:hypothetical protein